MSFSANVWGPHYWFFLHTLSHAYPLQVTAVTKRKYYDLIQNFPLFIPDAKMGDEFSKMLDKYPVSPYLDNRDSFIRWVHFIHNKYNEMLGKEELSLYEGIDRYLSEYKPKPVYMTEKLRVNTYVIHGVFILICILVIYRYYT